MCFCLYLLLSRSHFRVHLVSHTLMPTSSSSPLLTLKSPLWMLRSEQEIPRVNIFLQQAPNTPRKCISRTKHIFRGVFLVLVVASRGGGLVEGGHGQLTSTSTLLTREHRDSLAQERGRKLVAKLASRFRVERPAPAENIKRGF